MKYVWFIAMVISVMFCPLVVSHETTFGLICGIIMAVVAVVTVTGAVISVRRDR